MNVLRYCNLDESLQEEDSLVWNNALDRLYRTKELDYMSYIVLRLFENTEVGNLVWYNGALWLSWVLPLAKEQVLRVHVNRLCMEPSI